MKISKLKHIIKEQIRQLQVMNEQAGDKMVGIRACNGNNNRTMCVESSWLLGDMFEWNNRKWFVRVDMGQSCTPPFTAANYNKTPYSGPCIKCCDPVQWAGGSGGLGGPPQGVCWNNCPGQNTGSYNEITLVRCGQTNNPNASHITWSSRTIGGNIPTVGMVADLTAYGAGPTGNWEVTVVNQTSTPCNSQGNVNGVCDIPAGSCGTSGGCADITYDGSCPPYSNNTQHNDGCSTIDGQMPTQLHVGTYATRPNSPHTWKILAIGAQNTTNNGHAYTSTTCGTTPSNEECCKWCKTQTGGNPPAGCFDWMCTDPQWISDYCEGLGRTTDKPIGTADTTGDDLVKDLTGMEPLREIRRMQQLAGLRSLEEGKDCAGCGSK